MYSKNSHESKVLACCLNERSIFIKKKKSDWILKNDSVPILNWFRIDSVMILPEKFIRIYSRNTHPLRWPTRSPQFIKISPIRQTSFVQSPQLRILQGPLQLHDLTFSANPLHDQTRTSDLNKEKLFFSLSLLSLSLSLAVWRTPIRYL